MVFGSSKESVEELGQNISDFLDVKSLTLHGDMDQGTRHQVLIKFKSKGDIYKARCRVLGSRFYSSTNAERVPTRHLVLTNGKGKAV